MKIEKAIEILKTTDNRDITPASQDFRDAIKLGIEALEAIKHTRAEAAYIMGWPLSGETED